MGTFDKRLASLEAERTPKQVILQFLSKMGEFPNQDEFVRWCYTNEALTQMAETREGMYEAVRRRTPSKLANDLNRACRKAHRDFCFLYDLALTPSQNLEMDRYRFLYYVSLLAHWISSFWRHFKESSNDNILFDEVLKASQLAKSLTVELLSISMTAKAIAQKYFNGAELLFSDQLILLERLTAHTQQMTEHLNEAISLLQVLNPEWEDLASLSVDIEAPYIEVANKVDNAVSRMEREARIKLYESEGRHDEAICHFQQLIHPAG